MTPDENKTLERLVEAINVTYGSSWRTFWRGFLMGLGRGLGHLIGWIILLAVLIYLFKISGLGETFKSLTDTLGKISNSFQNLPLR